MEESLKKYKFSSLTKFDTAEAEVDDIMSRISFSLCLATGLELLDFVGERIPPIFLLLVFLNNIYYTNLV